MDINNRAGLKTTAAARLEKAPQARRIVLLWAGASALVSLAVSLLHFLLDSRIELTGGLSGIGLRTALSTAQSLLSTLGMVLMPFWSLGYTACVLGFARQEHREPRGLLEGFRRFGPALRLMLLRYALYLGLALAAMHVGIMVLSMTPLANPLYEFMESNQELLNTGVLTEELLGAMGKAVTPILVGCLVIYGAVVIPVSYRLRLAELRLMDDPKCGALEALRCSTRLMRHRCMALVKLDLSFWWYFLAEVVAAALCYGDMFLPALGIDLPMSGEVAFFVFYIIGMAAQVGLLYCRGNYVQTTYGLFYCSLAAPSRMPEGEA